MFGFYLTESYSSICIYITWWSRLAESVFWCFYTSLLIPCDIVLFMNFYYMQIVPCRCMILLFFLMWLPSCLVLFLKFSHFIWQCTLQKPSAAVFTSHAVRILCCYHVLLMLQMLHGFCLCHAKLSFGYFSITPGLHLVESYLCCL